MDQFDFYRFYKDPVLLKIFSDAGKFLKKTGQKGVFRHFLKTLTKKSRFPARAPLSKLVIMMQKAPFENLGGCSAKNGCRGDPLEKIGNQN